VVANYASASRQGAAAFGDAGVFVEKYVQRARHIEVQIFGDGEGAVVAFPERECSIQRRHQKILEETPSPFVTPELRAALQGAAVRLGRLAKYRWAAPHTAHCPHSLDSRRCTLLGGGNGSLGWQGCREVVEAP
jgi:acetyl/propionyl-CoA carboxylase alpha subunit